MPKGELFINEKDAYEEWGISMTTASLSTLMTPAGQKDMIETTSRLEDGKRVVTDNPKIADRSLSLAFQLTAPNRDQFFARYESFCKELEKGVLEINTSYQPDVMYRTIYLSCSQFTQFMQGIASFTLKLNEPDPTNRGL